MDKSDRRRERILTAETSPSWGGPSEPAAGWAGLLVFLGGEGEGEGRCRLWDTRYQQRPTRAILGESRSPGEQRQGAAACKIRRQLFRERDRQHDGP
ncbi:MAG: hypothetical protein NTW75_17510 [Planctomycetales bacterium]|nr:hypothetical protein [Planctomycetales bacterium]